MKINHKSDVPLHRQIENEIRKLIASGKFNNGELLPKELDLATRFSVARNTVRQAINKMVIEGTLSRKKGVGTRVMSGTISTNLSKWHSFSGEMTEQGIHLVTHFIKVKTEAADKIVAARLQIRKGTKVLKLERVRGTTEEPFVLFESWFHPRIGLSENDDFSQPLYLILEQKYSVLPSRSSEELSAMAPLGNIATKLKLKKNVPVLCRKRVVFDPGDKPIEYNVGYYNSQKFSYKIDVLRD